MSKTISIGQLSDEVVKVLDEYGISVAEKTQKVIKSVGQECRDDIKANAPVSDENTRHYRDGWTVKFTVKSSTNCSATVHNKSKPGLAHLLENGHASRSGGRVNGRPHIEPARQRAEAKAIEKLKEAVRNG